MKINAISLAVFVAYLIAGTAGDVVLQPFPDVVSLGQTYTLKWTATSNYTYQIWLNRVPPQQGWQKIMTLADGIYVDSLEGHYDWTVESNLTVQGDYVLWVQGTVFPYNGRAYPNQTSTFNITSAHGSNGSSSSGSHGISGGVIAGVVIGAIVLIALIIGGCLLFTWRKRRSAVSRRQAAARATRLEPVVQGNFPGYQTHGRL